MDVASNKVAFLVADIAYQNIFSFSTPNMSDIEQVCERIVRINQGKIVFEGSILDVNRMDGIKKQIRVVLNGPWSEDQLEKLGEINEDEVLIEVEHSEATGVAPHLFSNFPVQDISVTDQPLERIIESIYLGQPAE